MSRAGAEASQPWLRCRGPGPGIDWDFTGYWALVGAFVGVSVAVLFIVVPRAPIDVQNLDSQLYFRATAAWLNGEDPWATKTPSGIPFAGPPTALLLNLPLIPFGVGVAAPFWAVAGLAGWLVTVRRLHLGPLWILFLPFLEGWFAGSPDPALMGLVVVGGGAIAAAAKPYSVPAMIADRTLPRVAALLGHSAQQPDAATDEPGAIDGG